MVVVYDFRKFGTSFFNGIVVGGAVGVEGNILHYIASRLELCLFQCEISGISTVVV